MAGDRALTGNRVCRGKQNYEDHKRSYGSRVGHHFQRTCLRSESTDTAGIADCGDRLVYANKPAILAGDECRASGLGSDSASIGNL